MLRPSIEFVAVITAITILTSMFGLIYVMTGGGPGSATYMPEFLIWLMQGQFNRLGYASAMSVVLFVVVGLVGMAQIRMMRGSGSERCSTCSAARKDASCGSPASAMMVLALTTIYPIVFTFSTALKSTREYIRHGFALPLSPTFDKYVTAWTTSKLDSYFINSVIVTVIGVVLVLFISSLAGYALAQLRFRFRRLIFLLLLTGLMIPVQVIMVPLFRTIVELGMLNSRIGLGIVYGAFFSPFGVYLMASYYTAIPGELSEAREDGRRVALADLPADHAAARPPGADHARHPHDAQLLERRPALLARAAGEPHADGRHRLAARRIRSRHPAHSVLRRHRRAPVIAVFLIFQRKILGGILVRSRVKT